MPSGAGHVTQMDYPKKRRHEFTMQVDRNVGGSRNRFSTMLQSQMDFDLIFLVLSSHFNYN